MEKPKLQLPLWVFFEVMLWIAVAIALVSQLDGVVICFSIPYVILLRFLSWDLWHCEWLSAATCFILALAGTLFGLAIVGVMHLIGDLDPQDAFPTSWRVALVGSWAGSIGAILLRMGEPNHEAAAARHAGDQYVPNK